MTCDWCPQKCTEQFPACFQRYRGSTDKKNPGNIHELHILAQRIKPKYYDGIELDYAHRLAANKNITCNWVWSHTRPSGFRFGGIYSLRLYDDFLVCFKSFRNIEMKCLIYALSLSPSRF